MSCESIPADTPQKIIATVNQLLKLKSLVIEHKLFPNSIYITDNFYPEGHPEKFVLIFNISINLGNLKVGNIKYYQIPTSLHRQGFGRQIYWLIEEEFRRLHCQQVSVDATAGLHSSIGFWQRLGFNKSPYCFKDCDVCPMYKELVKI